MLREEEGKCNGHIKKPRDKKTSGNKKIQKLAHDEFLTKPSHVHPKMKEDVTSFTPLMKFIVYSKLTTLIINQS